MIGENKPEDIDRRDALKVIAVGSSAFLPLAQLGPAPASTQVHSAAAKTAATSAWKPAFFTEAQNELATTIAELIIPETDTPGARAVRVNEHMDLVLNDEIPEVQRAFRNGLAWIDRKSQQLYDAEFLKLSSEQQKAILSRVSNRKNGSTEDEPGHRFFLDIRRRTVFAYYTSKAGIHEELAYKGRTPLPEWAGCPHPEHHDVEGERGQA